MRDGASSPTKTTASPGVTPCRAARRRTRSAYSARSARATALPSMIFAVTARSARRLNAASVAVVFGLVRPARIDAEIARLRIRERRERGAELLELQARHLLVEGLRQAVHADRVLRGVGVQ